VSAQGLAVQVICSCDEVPDEGVEVLVLRGLLTATTSLTFTLHGQALLLAVRTAYNIHLMSRSEVNQTTAKATLTQMLNVVMQRMEAGSVKCAVSADVAGLVCGRARACLGSAGGGARGSALCCSACLAHHNRCSPHANTHTHTHTHTHTRSHRTQSHARRSSPSSWPTCWALLAARTRRAAAVAQTSPA
jgi:hypothetical protein